MSNCTEEDSQEEFIPPSKSIGIDLDKDRNSLWTASAAQLLGGDWHCHHSHLWCLVGTC